MIRLLAILIEILPLSSKLVSRRSPYEAAYLAVHDGQRARWDRRRETALYSAIVEGERRRAIADGIRETTQRLVDRATDEALNSNEARESMDQLRLHILEQSVKVARRAAARVFEDNSLEEEITEAARARRRKSDDRIVDAEAEAAEVLDDLERAAKRSEQLRVHDLDPENNGPRQNGRGPHKDGGLKADANHP